MIDPRTVLVAIPTYNGEIKAELGGMLVANSRFYASISFTVGVSHVSLARNVIAEKFLRSPFDWLLCIDADIVPGMQDFPLILAENEHYADADDEHRVPSFVPVGDGAANADVLVCAEYSYKDDSCRPVRMGLGFTRIHRSVFEKIAELKREDGSAIPWQFVHQGRLFTDFYPSGPLLSQLIPNGEWKGEDHGFFMLAALAGIVPRIETRTRLMHVGTKGFPYRPNEAGAN